MLLKGKVALITGASTGIGQTGSIVFAREGAKVIIADVNDVEGEKTIGEIKKGGGEAAYIHTDMTSVSQVELMVKKAAEIYGRLDIFWHNAGGSVEGHIGLTTEASYDRQMDINLRAGVFGVQAVIPVMRRNSGGCVLFTSSMLGLRPTPYSPSYSLTYELAKAGLVMLVRSLVTPLARENIRVNCICPGPVSTPRVLEARKHKAQIEGKAIEEYTKASTARVPMGREITREEVASAALFLVSDMASAITGAALPVDGGFSAV